MKHVLALPAISCPPTRAAALAAAVASQRPSGRGEWRLLAGLRRRGSCAMDPDNFVAQDNYWKDQIGREAEAAKRWAEKWGFLKTPLEELMKGYEKKEDAKPKLQLPDHLQIRPVTPIEKYIKVLPSPPVPETTQGFIGWRSADPAKALEHDFQIRSSKGAVLNMK